MLLLRGLPCSYCPQHHYSREPKHEPLETLTATSFQEIIVTARHVTSMFEKEY